MAWERASVAQSRGGDIHVPPPSDCTYQISQNSLSCSDRKVWRNMGVQFIADPEESHSGHHHGRCARRSVDEALRPFDALAGKDDFGEVQPSHQLEGG
ncbi:MAG: hypothetical protein FE78DRAFT_381377 [Acidomyces sp. 'richmondensis']|nr:MAG: hypothetical protein FE78DRAFT_381377 [Acidomyces sp. 'richmondensis']